MTGKENIHLRASVIVKDAAGLSTPVAGTVEAESGPERTSGGGQSTGNAVCESLTIETSPLREHVRCHSRRLCVVYVSDFA